MSLSKPIDVVPIRDLVLRPEAEARPPDGPPPNEPTPEPPPCPVSDPEPSRREPVEGACPEQGRRAFSDPQRRELAELLETLLCDVRQRALETLAPGDSVPVGQLARRMGVAQPTVSNHLNILRRMGLVDTRKVGRCKEYQAAPGLVRLEQRNGTLTLTVSCPSGATVTLAATMSPAASPEPLATPAVSIVEPDGAPMTTDKEAAAEPHAP